MLSDYFLFLQHRDIVLVTLMKDILPMLVCALVSTLYESIYGNPAYLYQVTLDERYLAQFVCVEVCTVYESICQAYLLISSYLPPTVLSPATKLPALERNIKQLLHNWTKLVSQHAYPAYPTHPTHPTYLTHPAYPTYPAYQTKLVSNIDKIYSYVVTVNRTECNTQSRSSFQFIFSFSVRHDN